VRQPLCQSFVDHLLGVFGAGATIRGSPEVGLNGGQIFSTVCHSFPDFLVGHSFTNAYVHFLARFASIAVILCILFANANHSQCHFVCD
jgi:hypothetical protein